MFQPTHRHEDGGFYRYVGECPGKLHFEDSEWGDGVVYQAQDDTLRWTSAKRWATRFTALENIVRAELKNDRIIRQQLDLANVNDELVCSFSLNHEDVGDVRHFWVTRGYQRSSVIQKEVQDHMIRSFKAIAEQVAMGLHIRDHDFPDLIGDVAAFHAKFGQEYTGKPRVLPGDLHDFRVKFHDEETSEYEDEYLKLKAAVTAKDRRDILHSLETQLDSLADAVWVLLGTADLQFGRKIFYEAWRRVVKANMAKVLATDDPTAQDSGREIKYDIRKPAGWLPPDHSDLIEDNAIFDEWHKQPEETNTFNEDAGPIRYSDTRSI